MHLQSVVLLLPAGDMVEGGQAMQVVDPDLSEYFPASHTTHLTFPETDAYLPASHPWHGPPAGPVKPALHVQASCFTLWGGASLPSGHWLQTVAPSALLYDPREQERQLLEPLEGL